MNDFQKIQPPLLYRKEDGTQAFVHDTFEEFFLAKAVGARLEMGEISVEEAHSICSDLDNKKKPNVFGEFDCYSWLYYSDKESNPFHYSVAESAGESFISDSNKFAFCAVLEPYLHKSLEFEYFETGDDDEGYRWDRTFKMNVILDGVVSQGKRVYFATHQGTIEHILSPGWKPVPEYVDGGMLRGIYHKMQQLNLDIIFRPIDYVQNSQYRFFNANGMVNEKNSFLEFEFLEKNGFTLLLG